MKVVRLREDWKLCLAEFVLASGERSIHCTGKHFTGKHFSGSYFYTLFNSAENSGQRGKRNSATHSDCQFG